MIYANIVSAFPQTYCDFGSKGLTMPDGMTTDILDNKYVAVFNGNAIYRVSAK